MESVAKGLKIKRPENILLAHDFNNFTWDVPKRMIGIWRFEETFIYYFSFLRLTTS